jgi:hypothetical protein
MSVGIAVSLGVGALLLGLGAVFAVALVGIRWASNRHGERLRLVHPDATMVDAGANCFGLESRGVTQNRGNGVLLLTPTELLFYPLASSTFVRIDRAAIVQVDLTRGHLGKQVGRDLLRVAFMDPSGAADTVAWYVPTGAERWRSLLAPAV